MWRNSHSKGWYASNIEWQIMRSTMKAIIVGAILGFGSIAPSLAADLPARPYSAPASYVLSNTTGRASMSAPTADMEGFRIVFASQGLLTCFSKRAATMPEEASRVVRWDIAGNSAEFRWSGDWK